ncbi:MAG: DUF4982 domain-containing protein, partial [Verrucomicrobiota bacterium]
LDSTRAVTAAVCLGNVFTGVNRVVDVRGWNYNLGPATDNYHREHPEQPNIGSEQASTMGTRGIYSDEATNGYVSAYDHSPYPTYTAEGWWSFTAERPWLSGGFVWTGFDYRGEPSPYDWPCISSHFGILDTCGFPKDNFYYYQSWWTTNTVLHLLPHWNWPGKEGRDIEVCCHSNCQEVELFLNGQSQCKKAMPRNSHLQWTVKYTPGTLSAKGYINGKESAETKVETTGAPARIQLVPDRSRIYEDGKDLSMVTVLVADAEGRRVPMAGDLIHFEMTGPGKIIGVGNGDPSCHEPDVYLSQPATLSGTMNQWWMMKVKPDSEAKEHPEVVEKAIKNHWNWYSVQTDCNAGCLDAGQWAVYRAHLFLSDMDLALTNYPIRFGSIRDDGWIYVNGKLAGESHDPAASPSFDVRKFLHAGFNTIAVLVKSKQRSGGLCQGVSVELQNTPAVANWKRSVFNGLAQIIVQSGQTIGDIKLTATADGLSTAETTIQTEPEPAKAHLRTLFIAGDSTAAPSKDVTAGWGVPFTAYFDLKRINLSNCAVGGTSSRTFIAGGAWGNLINHLKAGDVVLIQFGHNDASPINETESVPPHARRSRGTLPGIGAESMEIDNILTKQHEVIHTYGWYLRKMIRDVQGKGATPIILSLTPHNNWKDGKIELGRVGDYRKWSEELAGQAGVPFIEVTKRVADEYDRHGQAQVKLFFPHDAVHTNPQGADLVTSIVVAGLRALKSHSLDVFLSEQGRTVSIPQPPLPNSSINPMPVKAKP